MQIKIKTIHASCLMNSTFDFKTRNSKNQNADKYPFVPFSLGCYQKRIAVCRKFLYELKTYKEYINAYDVC